MSDFYRFGEFVLDPGRRTLSRADSPISLTPKAFDVLLFLARNPNRLVTKEELLQAVWGDTFVEEGNLTQYISHLRKALGDNSEDARLIATIARKGYQFTVDVTVAEAAHTTKHAAAQVSTSESSLADMQPVLGSPADETVLVAPKHWRNAAALAALAVILAVVTYTSRRHFARMTPPGSQKIMLAVMPFENLTGDPNKEYLADGLTEETISQLGRLNPEQLGVIARTSVMGYKHTEIELVHYDPVRAFLNAIAYHALGRKKESDAALRELITKYHATNACEIATVYAFRNQPDEAFEWLERAYAQRDSGLMGNSLKVDPFLKNLHGDPRFAALLKKLNLPI